MFCCYADQKEILTVHIQDVDVHCVLQAVANRIAVKVFDRVSAEVDAECHGVVFDFLMEIAERLSRSALSRWERERGWRKNMLTAWGKPSCGRDYNDLRGSPGKGSPHGCTQTQDVGDLCIAVSAE